MGSRQSTGNSPSRMVHHSNVNGSSDNNNSSFRSNNNNNNHNEQILSSNNSRTDWPRARSLTGVLTTSSGNTNRQHLRSTPQQISSAIDFFTTSSTNNNTTTSLSQDILNLNLNDDLSSSSTNSLPFQPHSFPIHGLSNQLRCLFCSKVVLPDDIECHYLMCITKPQLIYNEDILTEDKGECVICLDEMLKGNKIARLPCLCIYHKVCIDAWFCVNRSCPEHPGD